MTSSTPKGRPKIIDLRFVVDLILARYYIVLLVGRDQRSTPREIHGVNRWVNLLVATALLIGLNLLGTSILVLIAYLVKSLLGINLFPGHLGQC